MLTDEEALTAALDRSSGLDQLHPNDAFGAGFHAALAWLRSQGEPYTFIYELDTPLGVFRTLRIGDCNGRTPDRCIPVFLATQPAIPAGWQLVPKEPTPEMVKAGNIGQGFSKDALKAAIAAAPEPKSC